MTSGLYGAVFFSAWIKYCAALMVESMDKIFGMLNFLGGNSTVSEIFWFLFWVCMPYFICSAL